MKPTRANYEEYLNEVMKHESPANLSVKEGTYIANPGTWMRRNDPIQFEVGYNEYCQEATK